MKLHRPLLTIVLALGLCPLAPAESPGADIQPNVVLIRADDLARWAVGWHGNRDVITPNIDRIHSEGAAFTNAFVTTPVCSPSRVALMTGMYGTEAGITDWIRPKDMTTGLRPEWVTLPEVFKSAGYATGLFGKWHLGNAPEHHPIRNGFDEFTGFVGGGRQPRDPEIEVQGEPRKFEGRYLSSVLGEAASDFIGRRLGGPFFLMLDFRSPHTPYGPEDPEDTAAQKARGVSALPDDPGLDRRLLAERTLAYYTSIAALDRAVGVVLDKLDAAGVAGNTIVVFTSDHGYMIGHHGLWHKGNAVFFDREGAEKPVDPHQAASRRPNMFDDSIRVPLAVRWPGQVRPGLVLDAMVLQTDLYSTLPGLAGIGLTPPAGQTPRGIDLAPLLRGGTSTPRDAIFCEYDMDDDKHSRMRMIRTRDWKLVRHFEEPGMGDELFDLRRDPGERRNLIDEPAARAAVPALDERLRGWCESINDPMLRSGNWIPPAGR